MDGTVPHETGAYRRRVSNYDGCFSFGEVCKNLFHSRIHTLLNLVEGFTFRTFEISVFILL